MAKQKESIIQDQIINYLKIRRLYVWQNKTQGTYDPVKKIFRTPGKYHLNGVADILGILPDGKFLAIEVKTKTGRLSEHQRQFLENIKRMNGIAFVARSLEDVYENLQGYFNKKWTIL